MPAMDKWSRVTDRRTFVVNAERLGNIVNVNGKFSGPYGTGVVF